MNIKLFSSKYSQVMNKALDVYTRQHKAIAQNIANGSNPDSKRINTDFSMALQDAEAARLRCSDPRHINSTSLTGMADLRQESISDESVDLTREMAELAEMQIRYDFVSRALSRFYRGISTAITGRNS